MPDQVNPGARRPPDAETIVLRSDVIEVVVLPNKGADIYAFVDRATGIDVLFKSPWGWRDPRYLPRSPDSRADGLARYAGGWQQLLPNAGPEREVDSVRRGYHGEAAVVAWSVQEQRRSNAALSVDLLSAPLRLTRQLTVDGPTLRVTDSVANLSPDSTEVGWVQHPGFGAPFIDEHCRIDCGARVMLTDAEAPGTHLPPDVAFDFPHAVGIDGSPIDLRVVPGQGVTREIFGVLSDFDDPWYSVVSPSAGFGVRMNWDAQTYPHAWFWQECHATTGFPWFGRAYVVAIEPANFLPGRGRTGRLERGRGPLLAAGATTTTSIELSRIPLADASGDPKS